MTGIRAKIKKAVGIAIFAAIVIAVVFAVFTKISKKDDSGPTFVFGKALLWVETPSMEPTIEAKSFISVRKSDGKNLAAGDVITFLCTDKSSAVYGRLITHRIIEVTADGYKTKGDNSVAVDSWTVKPTEVVAVYEKNLVAMTYIGRVFSSGVGLVLIIGTFLFSCAFIYIPEAIAVLKEDKEAEKQKEIAERVEKEVERMLKENGSDDNEK